MHRTDARWTVLAGLGKNLTTQTTGQEQVWNRNRNIWPFLSLLLCLQWASLSFLLRTHLSCRSVGCTWKPTIQRFRSLHPWVHPRFFHRSAVKGNQETVWKPDRVELEPNRTVPTVSFDSRGFRREKVRGSSLKSNWSSQNSRIESHYLYLLSFILEATHLVLLRFLYYRHHIYDSFKYSSFLLLL